MFDHICEQTSKWFSAIQNSFVNSSDAPATRKFRSQPSATRVNYDAYGKKNGTIVRWSGRAMRWDGTRSR